MTFPGCQKYSQLERDLSITRAKANKLKRENKHLASKVERLTRRRGFFTQGVKKALSALHQLEPATTPVYDDEKDLEA